MPIYRFEFDSKYAGQAATVTDINGHEVAASPVTLDANGDSAISLTGGQYWARVSNTGPLGDGYSAVNGVFDVVASLDAEGGGGGGMSADTNEYYAETDPPQTPAGFGLHAVVWNGDWDTAGTTVDEGATHVVLAQPGAYWASGYVTFATPAQDTDVELTIGSLIGSTTRIRPGTSPTVKAYISGVVKADGSGIGMGVAFHTGDAVDPVVPTINFAYMSFVKLVDAT